MAEYRFDDIAINSTEKKKPVESDKEHYLGLEHLDSGTFKVSRFGSEVAPIGDKLIMKKGDVLFGKRRAYQKKVAIAPFDGIFSAHGMVLRPKEDVIYKNFFPLFIASDYFLDAAIKISVGSLSPTINWRDLKELKFNLPELDEQKKLAEVLWQIVDTMESYKKLLAKTDEMVKAKFVEMFGEINLFHEDTTWTPLKDVTKIITGTTPSTKDEENWNGEIPWITPAELDSNTLFVNETERHITENGRKSKHLEIMPIGTVLLSTRAPIGKVGITNIPMTCNQGFKNFICKENIINPIYLWYLLKNNTEYLKSRGAGTTFLELAKSTIEKIRIPLPDYSIQNQFASLVLKSEESKSAIQASLDSLSAVYKKIIAENLGGSN